MATAAAPAPAAKEAAPVTPAAAAPTQSNPSAKVFVGNISFKTREADLAHEFEVAGKVLSANIITRGPRSLGYGFVEFETSEAAHKAVELLNHKEIDGRPINVEVAKTRDAAAAAAQQQPRPPRRQFRGPPMAFAPRQFFQPQMQMMQPVPAGRGPKGQPQQFIGVPPAPAQMMGYMAQPMMARMPMGFGRPRGLPKRGPRQQNQNKTPSKTTLFVANLPFEVEDETLKEIFSEFNVKDAHVVKRPNGRSKGYGFVELQTEEDQRRALQTLDKIEVEGRELIIKPAVSEPAAPMTVTKTPAAPAKTEAAAPAKP